QRRSRSTGCGAGWSCRLLHSGDHAFAADAQRAVLRHFGQMPPAAAAFVVGGGGDYDTVRSAALTHPAGDEYLGQFLIAMIAGRDQASSEHDFGFKARTHRFLAPERL